MKERVLLYRILKPIGAFFFRILFFPTIVGRERIPKEGAIILAGNHISSFDPLLVITSNKRVIHFLGKIELFKTKFSSWFFHSVGVIPVDRKKKKNPEAMREAENVLKEGYVVGIFPEGTTRKGLKEMRPFKFGAVAMAKHTGTKIVPFGITGSYKIFRKRITIRYGEALDLSSYSLEEANEILRSEVEKLSH